MQRLPDGKRLAEIGDCPNRRARELAGAAVGAGSEKRKVAADEPEDCAIQGNGRRARRGIGVGALGRDGRSGQRQEAGSHFLPERGGAWRAPLLRHDGTRAPRIGGRGRTTGEMAPCGAGDVACVNFLE